MRESILVIEGILGLLRSKQFNLLAQMPVEVVWEHQLPSIYMLSDLCEVSPSEG